MKIFVLLHDAGSDHVIARPVLTNQQPVTKLLVKVINIAANLDHLLDMFLEVKQF